MSTKSQKFASLAALLREFIVGDALRVIAVACDVPLKADNGAQKDAILDTASYADDAELDRFVRIATRLELGNHVFGVMRVSKRTAEEWDREAAEEEDDLAVYRACAALARMSCPEMPGYQTLGDEIV